MSTVEVQPFEERLILIVPFLISFFLLSNVSIAHACSVCFSGSGDIARYAYYATTLGLILIPTALVTAFVLWIRSAESDTGT